MALLALTLCLLFLAVPHQAHASSRGSFGRKHVPVYPPVDGICASSVTVYGYKCQELEVRTPNMLYMYIHKYFINLQWF